MKQKTYEMILATKCPCSWCRKEAGEPSFPDKQFPFHSMRVYFAPAQEIKVKTCKHKIKITPTRLSSTEGEYLPILYIRCQRERNHPQDVHMAVGQAGLLFDRIQDGTTGQWWDGSYRISGSR